MAPSTTEIPSCMSQNMPANTDKWIFRLAHREHAAPSGRLQLRHGVLCVIDLLACAAAAWTSSRFGGMQAAQSLKVPRANAFVDKVKPASWTERLLGGRFGRQLQFFPAYHSFSTRHGS